MTDMPEHVIPLQYSSTNTYLIRGRNGILLFDTGWAGTFREFCREMGEKEIPVQEISYVLISHFHPDHCGIAQEIADCGAQVAVMDVQREFVHAADDVLRRGQGYTFHPIDDSKTRLVRLEDSRRFLAESGIDGEILATPGHSDDSISLCLDGGCFFVGDLNPLYELEMHRGTRIGESWEMLLARCPKMICYGHARTALLSDPQTEPGSAQPVPMEQIKPDAEQVSFPESAQKTFPESRIHDQEYALVRRIMKYTDRGYSAEKIQKKMKADVPVGWVRDVMRMYLTHTDVSVQGILDRMEIRGR